MNCQTTLLKDVSIKLTELRSDSRTSRKFPKELWDSVISLTNIYSIKEVCQHLKISPIYLKRKMNSTETQFQHLDFQELPNPAPKENYSNAVIIELSFPNGLKAKIQGPLSCCHSLYSLLKE